MDNFEKSAVLVLIGAAISRDYLGYAFLGCAIMFAARIAEYVAFDARGDAKNEVTSRQVSPLVEETQLASHVPSTMVQERSSVVLQVKDDKEQLNAAVANMSTEEYFKNVKPLFATSDQPEEITTRVDANSSVSTATSRDTGGAISFADTSEMNDEEFIEMIVNSPDKVESEGKKPRMTKPKRGKPSRGGAKDGEPLSQSIFRVAPHADCAMMEEREETSMIQHYSSKMCGETFDVACNAVAKDGMKVHIAQANHSSRIVQPTQYDLKTIVVKVEDPSFDFVNNAPSDHAIVTDVIGIARYDPDLPINRTRK